MIYRCPEEQFLNNVKNHKMEILKEDGVYRHIRFKRPGSFDMYFDIITWPDYLCYTGDMGTYVFTRLMDMFNFFRPEMMGDNGSLYINPGYWGEKLKSFDVHGEFEEFDAEMYKANLWEYFDLYWEGPDDGAKEECREEIEEALDFCDNEHEFYQFVKNFEHEGFSFDHFFDDGTPKRYSFRFIWCCYALAWAVKQYDAEKGKNDAKKTRKT